MAIIDAANRFDQNQAGYNQNTPLLEGELVTATALLSGVIDRQSSSDTGAGKPIFVSAQVAYGDGSATYDFNPTTSATFDVLGCDTQPADNSHVADSGVNAVVLSTSGAVLTAKLKAGSIVQMPPITPGIKKRFIMMRVTTTGGNATTGAIVAGLIDEGARPQTFVQPGGGPTGHTV